MLNHSKPPEVYAYDVITLFLKYQL